MKTIYIRETEETCDFVKRVILKIKKIFSIIKVENSNNRTIYYLPLFINTKISKYRAKKLATKIYKLLEKDASNVIVLSEYLDNNQLFKNYLYSNNINILDGRYLFKCLSERILEYIFKIKGKEIEKRRSFYIN